jgi:GAF domain-containing protein
LYYVGLFLVDEAYQWAVLQAGTGRAGQTMLSRGHRIKVGEGMIGWSIANAQPRVAMEADQDGVRLATPELPATRSEAALPLRSRGRVLGAFTVQHTRPGAFDDETMTVLQTMTDQVAVALDNARLFTESQAALEASKRAYGELSRQAWTEILRPRADWGYRYSHQTVAPVEGDWRQEMLQAEAFDQIVREEDADRPTLAIPLKVRDQVVGALSFRKDDRGETWTDEEVALLAMLTEQLGLALESARLYQDTQRRAAHERLTGEVTARLRESLDVETVLKTAAQEVRQALGLPEVVVRLISENVAQAGNGIGQNEA